MLVRILCSLLLVFGAGISVSQEVLLPLNSMPGLAGQSSNKGGEKAGKSVPVMIEVDLDSNKHILLDDFSYNNHRPYDHYWRDRTVYVNRNFPIYPITVGVATFDGLDQYGYPYNFITANAYGSCDTLTSLPIELGKVDLTKHHPIYLTFAVQPQGMNPYPNSPGDSIALEFFRKYDFDTTIVTHPGPPPTYDTIIDTTVVNEWFYAWSEDGHGLLLSDSCSSAMKVVSMQVDPVFYQDSFQFRFRSFGNQAGSVDQWHLDFVVLSSDSTAHSNLGDYAFLGEIPSLIRLYEAMPWFHYVGKESHYALTAKMNYRMRNTFSSMVEVNLLYRAEDANGIQIDSIIVPNSSPVSAKNCRVETMPLPGDPLYTFKFPASSAPVNSTTYFIKKQILERTIGSNDIFEDNNEVESFQVFGTYYAYDDGSAEAGYGVKSDKGKVAIRFVLAPGISDTLTGVYFYFNPVVIDRTTERFRLTVWNNDNGIPGDIIYESSLVDAPVYPAMGVNYFTRIDLESDLLVSDTFYVGYQKITEEVLNLGYDLNRKNNDKVFYSVGGPWIQSTGAGGIMGTVMLRPAFRRVPEVEIGVQKVTKKETATLKVYPNPANQFITFEIKNKAGIRYQAELYSMEGRLLSSFSLVERMEIDVSAFQNGFYIARLVGEDGNVLNGKFLVNH